MFYRTSFPSGPQPKSNTVNSIIFRQDAWLLVQEGRRNEVLLTPFAQLLLKMQNIRENVVKLTGRLIDQIALMILYYLGRGYIRKHNAAYLVEI